MTKIMNDSRYPSYITETKRSIRGKYEKWYANKVDDLHKVDKYLGDNDCKK